MKGYRLGTRAWRLRVFVGVGFLPVLGMLLCLGPLGLVESGFCRTPASRKMAPSVRITVRLHDYAHLSRGTLEGAKRGTARIFQEVGIETTWVDCPTATSKVDQDSACLKSPDSPHFDVNVLPRFMATRISRSETSLGITSFRKEGERAFVASIFYDRVEDEAGRTALSRGLILAYVMAHELGHLLLCTSGHTPTGIMRAHWSAEDLRRVGLGRLLFTPEQAESIRTEVGSLVQAQAVEHPTTAAPK